MSGLPLDRKTLEDSSEQDPVAVQIGLETGSISMFVLALEGVSGPSILCAFCEPVGVRPASSKAHIWEHVWMEGALRGTTKAGRRLG